MRRGPEPMALSSKLAVAATKAGTIQIIVVGTLLIVHESSARAYALFQHLTGHHWLTLSVLTVILFPLLVVAVYRSQRSPTGRLRPWTTVFGVVTGLFVLVNLGYFLVKYLRH